MEKERKVMQAWHDEELNLTKYGLNMMRYYLLTGFILGLALGFFVCLTFIV